MADSSDEYVNLITSEHSGKPDFEAIIRLITKPLADNANLLATMANLFDVDIAVGAQLDVVGLWVGETRYITVPIVGVFFSFDISGVGFDQGVWAGPFNPTTEIVVLPDEFFRILIKAKIVANQWNGSVPNAYLAWDTLFEPEGYSVAIVDHGDMTMGQGLIGPPPTPLLIALFTGGYLDLRPSGVLITDYFYTTTGGPIFGLDSDGPGIEGLDLGSWSTHA